MIELSNYKIAIFDFCETLVNFQTADAYIEYVKSRMPLSYKSRAVEYFRKVLSKFNLITFFNKCQKKGNINKRLLLYELKGLEYSVMNRFASDFFEYRIKKNYINETIEVLQVLKSRGYKIIIASGGYELYLNYVKQDLGIDQIIATKLFFKNDRFMGVYDGLDVIGINKLKAVENALGVNKLDQIDTISFSDSFSDLPLLTNTRKGVIVSKTEPPWASVYNLGVILWGK